MLRRAILAGLTAAVSLAPLTSHATEPTPFLNTSDSGDGFDLRLSVPADIAPALLATVRFNRFAGRVVGADEQTVNNIPVERELEIVADPLGGFRMSFGTNALPDGVYSGIVSIELVQSLAGVASHVQNHAVYARVTNGVASRISLTTYSGLVDPTSIGRGKNGEQVVQHVGSLLAAAVAPAGAAADTLVETGGPFAGVGDERNER